VPSGEITFKITEEVTVGATSTCVFLPRGVPHVWKSTGTETARILFLYTPATAAVTSIASRLRVGIRARNRHRPSPV
jgi:hypothetical protein